MNLLMNYLKQILEENTHWCDNDSSVVVLNYGYIFSNFLNFSLYSPTLLSTYIPCWYEGIHIFSLLLPQNMSIYVYGWTKERILQRRGFEINRLHFLKNKNQDIVWYVLCVATVLSTSRDSDIAQKWLFSVSVMSWFFHCTFIPQLIKQSNSACF